MQKIFLYKSFPTEVVYANPRWDEPTLIITKFKEPPSLKNRDLYPNLLLPSIN